jgi:hypothetical protein
MDTLTKQLSSRQPDIRDPRIVIMVKHAESFLTELGSLEYTGWLKFVYKKLYRQKKTTVKNVHV